MKPGDLIRHVKTGQTALLVKTWEEGHRSGVVEVLVSHGFEFPAGICRWFRSSCKVINESR
jgi:hypothetical protein